MRRNEMQSLMNKIMERITETRDAGQKEYARDVDNVCVLIQMGINRKEKM
jgi:hypothetical protein